MNILPAEFRCLRPPLLVGLLMLFAGAVPAGLAYHLRHDAEQAAKAAKVRLTDVERRYRQAMETDRLTRQTLEAYETLQRAGLHQASDRLAWIESIRDTCATLHIEHLSYEIGPDQPLPDAASDRPEKSAIVVSTLRLQAPLAHEQQFLDLLEGLQRLTKALRPRHCTLSRSSPVPGTEPPQPALTASCDIDWISIRSAQQ